MTPFQRRTVHVLAQVMDMEHRSIGEIGNRPLHVVKDSRKTPFMRMPAILDNIRNPAVTIGRVPDERYPHNHPHNRGARLWPPSPKRGNNAILKQQPTSSRAGFERRRAMQALKGSSVRATTCEQRPAMQPCERRRASSDADIGQRCSLVSSDE
ncbi:hypothetical protein B0T26DRAFT_680847 [Lasiosphaeria miniovina]|uniref:R3H domain-containing protein n=1 Tax=Lasiosphaeria miniovina TaxID=1954250 RepID=A0AA39ZT13_9PEZI|nr:uncharacterized protein B0T26DRAFT_680847 [Lasiosphaeria miniovina]KAK0703105.1 hypothetical protein B0T26DRAFT_680847 [Lasiosphaeria miniovina]